MTLTDELKQILKNAPENSDNAYKFIKQKEIEAFRSKDKKLQNEFQAAWDAWENRNNSGGLWDIIDEERKHESK